MQIIQGIRDKGAVIFSIIIAIALVSFILMSADRGNGSKLFGGNTTTVGKVNGTSIELSDFNKRVLQAENKQAAQSGRQPGGAEVLQIRDQVWNQTVAENVFYRETEKLGITLTPEELSAILTSNDRSNPLLQDKSLTDASGNLDMAKAREAINGFKKMKDDRREMIDAEVIDPLRLTTAFAKYSGMISASAYYPTWMKDRDRAAASEFANISYTGVAYNEIPDSTVKVTDDDINSYVAKRKPLFKQEAGRMISYLSFSQLASAADSANIRQAVEGLKSDFAADTSKGTKSFLDKNQSALQFNDKFLPLSRMSSPVKDTLSKLAPGAVYGPYVDGANYVLARMMATRQIPDSIKARHILIAVTDQQTQQPIMADSTAKKLADSILTAIKGGADFAALSTKYSADKKAALSGGDLGTFGYGTMVPEFSDEVFEKPVGEKFVVQSRFGYHVVENLNEFNLKPAFQIAYFGKQIVPSEETIDSANRAASQASQSKNGKELAAFASNHGMKITSLPGVTIKENDYSLAGMQDARSLIKWVFGASKGQVSDPIPVDNQIVVATVDKIYDEGTQDAQTARANAEAAVRNRKKADIIISTFGASPTLEKAAAAYNKQVLTAGGDSAITMDATIINGIGNEPKLIGAAFNKDYQNRVSPPIAGTTGVYLLKVNGISQKEAKTDAAKAAAETARLTAIRQLTNNWFEALRKQADIKDKRSKFF